MHICLTHIITSVVYLIVFEGQSGWVVDKLHRTRIAYAFLPAFDDEEEMDEDTIVCSLIWIMSATQTQGKSALLGLNPGVNLWSKIKWGIRAMVMNIS